MSLLGIDIGTSGCKAGAFNLDGVCLAQAYREYDMLHPEPGWSELDVAVVWGRIREVIDEVTAKVAGDPVTALSVSSFGEAVVAVTRDRKILDNSILCVDNRGGEHIDRLLETFTPESFYAINPNLIGAAYTMPKLMWLREHRQDVYDQADCFLHWADFVSFMLGADPTTNNSHANRTLLFSLEHNDWSDALLEWSGIPREKLAPVVSGGTVTGTVAPAIAAELGLTPETKIVAGGHDQCCNALGCGGISAGSAVYGLGSFDCITPIFTKPDDPQSLRQHNLNIEHHLLPDLYVSFLYNQAGLLIKWFRDTFATPDTQYDELMAEMPAEPTQLLVLPHFDMPPHRTDATAGAIVGLKMDTTRGEILKAIQEGIALYFVEGIEALRKIGIDTTSFIASGGGAKSIHGLQIRSDVFGIPIVRPQITEAGLLGAAMLAGMSTGALSSASQAVDLFVHEDCTLDPDPKLHQIYLEKHARYQLLDPAIKPLLPSS